MAYYYCKNDNLIFYDYIVEDCMYEYRGDGEGNYCLNPMCCEELIKIDENIAKTIVILNSKGYITTESCSGHFGFSDTYILFKNIYEFETLPNGFSRCSYNYNLIEKYYNEIIKSQAQIWETAKDLVEWAESLPDNKSGEFTKPKQTAWGITPQS